MTNQPGTMKTMENNQKPWKPMKLPWKTMETNQKPWKTMKLPWKTKQKRDPRGVTTDLGGAQGRNKQKRYVGGVKTDLLDV